MSRYHPAQRVGAAIIAASAVVFAYAFLRTTTGGFHGSCSGRSCLSGDSIWALAVPVTILMFVVGWMIFYYGGRGYGRTHGPKSFAEVDDGKWAPNGGRTRRADRPEVPTWTRTWRNLYFATGAGETAFAALFLIAAAKEPAVRSGFIFTGALLGAVGVVLLWVGWRATQKDRLHETGIEGRATIASVEQTGIQMNDNQYVKLDLIVHVAGHPDYEVEHNEIVPNVALGRLTQGDDLPVRVDPNRPSHLIVEWEHV